MRHALRYIIFSGFAYIAPSFFFSFSTAQERCATVEYSRSLYPDYERRQLAFEQWIATKKLQKGQTAHRQKQSPTYKIPVVVHIIHNGEQIGVGPNITDEQVLSQLRVLNEDFNRQNADATDTPPEFASVAGSLDVEFVLAKQDPDGLPTTGIIRVNGGRTGWTYNDNYTLKARSYWPAEEYMNIWVCNLTDQFVGYAQQPVSDLEGLEGSSTNRLTDGVVIWHRAFGSDDDGLFVLDPSFNKGRTTTHEVGHFLGLFHIWGYDTGCIGTDYVDDTPNQGFRTQGCPSHPRADACSEKIMFQNFMDYTDDRCMNLFTQGQTERMSIVLENSPRRSTLLTSHALEEPQPLANDLGIRTILAPDASVCSNLVTPVIEVRNYGTNTITTAQVRFLLDDEVKQTRNVVLSLAPEASTEITFSAVSIPSGTHEVQFEVLSTNGGADLGTYNNVESSTVVIPVFSDTPLTVDFETAPEGWIIRNFDDQVTWSIATAPTTASDNKALRLNYFSYEDKIGEVDAFLSPVVDLSDVPAATLSFDVAHARFQTSNDRLKVVVLTDCQDVFGGTTVYDKAGDALQTTPPVTSPFTPSNESQWRKELVDLSAFIGMDRVQIAFVGINDWGNNIYLDNIALTDEARRDIALVGLSSPSLVVCAEPFSSSLLIQNVGSIPLQELTITYAVNGGGMQSIFLDGLDIRFGETGEVPLPLTTLIEGSNSIAVSLTTDESPPDIDESNNHRTFLMIVNDSRDKIPLRQDFEGNFTPAWTIANPAEGGMTWKLIQTNLGQSLYFNAFDNENRGDESWLVSPVLDFSRASQARMEFDLSYNPPPGGTSETLAIYASNDCGVTFDPVTYDFPHTGFASGSWKPQLDAHWSKGINVDLSAYAGKSDVRIAFVVRNHNGNNMYIDNIEFFMDPDPGAAVEELYAVYGYDLGQPGLNNLRITFNLPERQHVRFSIINSLGQMETDGLIPDVLNQTYPLNLGSRLTAGIYFIRLQIGEKFYTTKVLVN